MKSLNTLNTLNLSYRKATLSDVPFIRRLNKRYLSLSSHTFDSYWVEGEVKFHKYYLLLCNGKTVGAIDILIDEDSSITHIECIAIQKNYQRKGLGGFAIQLTEKIAKKYKSDKIQVGSYCGFKARKFYEKMGFNLIEEGNDGFADYWDFEKKLAA